MAGGGERGRGGEGEREREREREGDRQTDRQTDRECVLNFGIRIHGKKEKKVGWGGSDLGKGRRFLVPSIFCHNTLTPARTLRLL